MKKTILYAILGFALGIPLSYLFQSGALRAKMSLADYLGNLPKLFEVVDHHPEYLITVVVTCVGLAIIGAILGSRIDKKRKAASS